MLSDDVYKIRFRQTVASIEAWLGGLRAGAEIDAAQDDVSWRISVAPHVREACPFEFVLRGDQQFDLSVGAEIYEDQPVDDLGLFLPMLNAIALGSVLTRSWSTAATDTLVKITSIIGPIPGKDSEGSWSRSRQVAPQRNFDQSDLICRDRLYAPYARGA